MTDMNPHKRMLLVGSVPLDTAEDVFRTLGPKLGAGLRAMPDGEPGPRQHWISRVHYQVFAGHAELEVLRHPAPEDGVERLNPRSSGDSWLFRVRPETKFVRFGERGWRLGYARDALNSYFVFATLRDKGMLPAHLRFQVSMPSVNSVLPPRLFPDVADLERIRPGYQQAVLDELGTIVGKIPHQDLAIQWDCSTEVQDAYGALPGLPVEDVIERNLGQMRALCPAIPAGVELGFHLCFGTLGGWPRFNPPDLSGAVALANGFIGAAGRQVNWMHIPAVDSTDPAYYAPLSGLQLAGADLYLGLIHHMESFSDRVALARTVAPVFGVGAYCGWGRIPPAELAGVIADHERALREI